MKYATKKNAKDIIEWAKETGQTAYFDGELNMSRMKEMFRDFGFGIEETNVIIASLVLAGAKFKAE